MQTNKPNIYIKIMIVDIVGGYGGGGLPKGFVLLGVVGVAAWKGFDVDRVRFESGDVTKGLLVFFLGSSASAAARNGLVTALPADVDSEESLDARSSAGGVATSSNAANDAALGGAEEELKLAKSPEGVTAVWAEAEAGTGAPKLAKPGGVVAGREATVLKLVNGRCGPGGRNVFEAASAGGAASEKLAKPPFGGGVAATEGAVCEKSANPDACVGGGPFFDGRGGFFTFDGGQRVPAGSSTGAGFPSSSYTRLVTWKIVRRFSGSISNIRVRSCATFFVYAAHGGVLYLPPSTAIAPPSPNASSKKTSLYKRQPIAQTSAFWLICFRWYRSTISGARYLWVTVQGAWFVNATGQHTVGTSIERTPRRVPSTMSSVANAGEQAVRGLSVDRGGRHTKVLSWIGSPLRCQRSMRIRQG
jgi:hypothetical protein